MSNEIAKTKRDALLRCMQSNLKNVRKAMGLSGTEFGKIFGMSRASVSKLENGKAKLTVAQYIAIRFVIDEYVRANPDNYIMAAICKHLDLYMVDRGWTDVIFEQCQCF